MPSVQRGQVWRLDGGSWAYRYRDENGRRRQVGGFKTKGEASHALASALGFARLGALGVPRDVTVSELAARYLAQHDVDPVTIATLRSRLRQAEAGLRRPEDHDVAARRVRRVAEEPLSRRASRRLPRAQASARAGDALEVAPGEPGALREESETEGARDRPLPVVGEDRGDSRRARPTGSPRSRSSPSGPACGPRSGSGSNGATLDRGAGVVTVERVYTQGRLKPCAKTSRQRRRVPLRQRVLDALEAVLPRLDSPSSSRPREAATSS